VDQKSGMPMARYRPAELLLVSRFAIRNTYNIEAQAVVVEHWFLIESVSKTLYLGK